MMTWATSQDTGHRKKSQTDKKFLEKFEASPPMFWFYFQINQSYKTLNGILKDFKDLFMFILGFANVFVYEPCACSVCMGILETGVTEDCELPCESQEPKQDQPFAGATWAPHC